MEWNKVWAIGRDTYVRFYPNPGIGICLGPRRVALSWVGGLEWFHADPHRAWIRRRAWLDRRKR